MEADVWTITRRSNTHHVNEDRAVVGETVFDATDGCEHRRVTTPALLAVLDGLGGHAAGDVASERTARLLAGANAPGDEEAVAELLHQADHDLQEAMHAEPGLAGMGTTVALLVLDRDGALVANAGDSSVWRLRNGVLETLAVSDRIGASGIAQCLGAGGGVEPHIRRATLRPGDRLLLASDGLTDVVPTTEAAPVLADDVERAATRLYRRVEEAHLPDDVTIIVAEVLDAEVRDPAAVGAELDNTDVLTAQGGNVA
jgi:PPM family protein phosphatase